MSARNLFTSKLSALRKTKVNRSTYMFYQTLTTQTKLIIDTYERNRPKTII